MNSMAKAFRTSLFTGIVLGMPCAAIAQTNNSYPMLMHLHPTAVQIGQATEHELSARYNLAGASQVIVSGEGVVGEVLPNDQEKPEDKTRNDVMASKCKLRFRVAADALPGVRDFRVMTPHGASTLGQLVVARDSIVSETADNDTMEKATAATIPAALCGIIEKAEDVDYYKFSADAGTALTFHMRSQRLMNRLHDMQTRIDPMITLRTENGSVIASSDNYYAGDPLLHHRFETAGTYFLEVRDVRYQGNADWTYVVEANARPFITQTHPFAGLAGQSVSMELIGFHLPAQATAVVAIDAAASPGLRWTTAMVDGQPTNEFPMLVTTDPVIVEQPTVAPQTTVATDGTAAKPPMPPAQPITLPSTLTGRIDSPGQVDRYAFSAKAQERYSFEIVARRANSELDSKIRIVNESGGVLIENDDATFERISNADSMIENWTVPADGNYVLEIRDLHQRGGPQFEYAVRARHSAPYFMLEADTDKTLLAPGMSSVVYVRVQRRNGFASPIQLVVSGLPSGVTATAGIIQADTNDGAILLHAAADAENRIGNIEIHGTATQLVPNGDPLNFDTPATPMQEYYLPGGGRGNYPVTYHTVSIAQPMDLRAVVLNATELVLEPGESKRLEVTVERAPDFKGNVTLDVLLQHLEQHYGNTLPKGVTVDVGASKTLLTGSETTGFITLKAAPDAKPVDKQLVPVNAHVSINFVMKHTFCAPPLYVSVVKK